MHRFPFEDQLKWDKELKKLEENVQKNWRTEGHANMLLCIPNLSSKYALVFILYKNSNEHKKKEFLNCGLKSCLAEEHVKYCLGLAINIDRDDYPYHTMALAQL